MPSKLARHYAPDQNLPLGSYAGLAGAYNAALLATVRHLHRHSRLPERFNLADSILLGLSTHKLSRIVARDWVTSPFRAPFAEYQGPRPGGEVDETSRGTGLRKAIGDLITCPYCTGPWVALGLASFLASRPRAARFTMSIFASVAISDFLHRLQGIADNKKSQLDAARQGRESSAEARTEQTGPRYDRANTQPGHGAGNANVLPRH